MHEAAHLELLFLRAHCQTAEAMIEMIVEKLKSSEEMSEKLLYIETLLETGCNMLNAEKLIHKKHLRLEADIIDIHRLS